MALHVVWCTFVTIFVFRFQQNTISVPALVSFCEESLLYTPSCSQTPPILHSTLPHQLYPLLLVAMFLCDPQVLVGCLSSSSATKQLAVLVRELTQWRVKESTVSLEDEASKQLWQDVVVGCLVAVESLSPSVLKPSPSAVSSGWYSSVYGGVCLH